MYVSNPAKWAELCVTDPRWLAETLQRIGRFSGQHPTSNVLIHSLEVWWEVRGAPAETQLWALYHDAHEALTNDIPRKFKPQSLEEVQRLMDQVLQARLGITEGPYPDVVQVDRELGDAERSQWADFKFKHDSGCCVDVFESEALFLLRAVSEDKGVVSCR